MSDESTKPSNPFASRGFIAAAIVIGVILLAGVIVLVTSLAAPRTPAAQQTSSPSSPVASGDEKSVCGLAGFETESSLTTAPETKWELVGTVAAPSDPKVGPGKVDSNGFRTCFAHTATGALYAAVNYIALGSDSRNADRMAELFVPGPGVDIALKSGSGTPSSARLQVAGFKVNSYSANKATVDVVWAVTSSDGQLVSYPTVLQWNGGDWKIVLKDDGQPPFAPSPLQSLGGYIPWAGV